MGFFSESMAPMLGVYEAETSELITAFDSIISRVEQEKTFEPEDIAELFRCAHTIKGSSAMMGLESLSTLTHRAEDLFDLLRNDPTLADGRIPDIIDHLYSFSDFVKDELDRIGNDDFTPADPGSLIDEIAADVVLLANGGLDREGEKSEGATAAEAMHESSAEGVPASGTAKGETTLKSTADIDEGGVTLKISFKPDVAMVNARALVIVKQLAKQVNVRSYIPDDLSNAETARTISEEGLLVVVDANDVEKAKDFLAKNSFIRRIVALEVTSAAQADLSSGNGKPISEASSTGEKFITLRWSNMRDLQDMAGEFLLQASRLKTLSTTIPNESELNHAVSHMARLVDDLVYRINAMAMVSMSAMVPRMSRIVRDMCRESGKQISFEVTGGDIEIDRNLYNSIADPLLHIIRNSVDHGIEPPEKRLAAGKEARGKIVLSIENLGARVAFRVSDDGCGIDTAKVLAKAEANGQLNKPANQYTRTEILRMVMNAGLSTSKEVTQYSGRGVGMDVVNTVVRDFNGQVVIESEPGSGTSITLFMPVAVTSVDSLGFRIGPSVYHLPLFNLSKIIVADEAADNLSRYEDSTLLTFEKRQIPVLDMHNLLDCQGETTFYIVCNSMGDEFVIGVDDVIGDFSCANKPLPACLDLKWLKACPIRGVTIMDDGSVGYALNAAILADLAQGRNNSISQLNDTDSTDDGDSPFEIIDAANLPPAVFVFTLGKDRYAIAVDQVERLIPLPKCAETPRSPRYLMGLANYRNKALAIFDLAKSAGAEDDCPYALVVANERGDCIGLTISSAIGVYDLTDAVLTEDQPEPRAFAGKFRSAALFTIDPKRPPINLLVRYE